MAVIVLEVADLPALHAAADPPLTVFERWMGQQLCELLEIDAAASALRQFAGELILDAAQAPDMV
jgi:hypothetical protein